MGAHATHHHHQHHQHHNPGRPEGAVVENCEAASTTTLPAQKLSTQSVLSTLSQEEIRAALDALESKRCKILHRIGDIIILFGVIFPVNILIWRGSFNLINDYYNEVPDNKHNTNYWLAIVIGYIVLPLSYYFQEEMKIYIIDGKMHFVFYYIISRTIVILNAFAGMNLWVGLWHGMDTPHILTVANTPTSLTLVVGICLHIFLRTMCNLVPPPLYCGVDDVDSVLDFPLCFETPPQEKRKYIGDIIFSVVVMPVLTMICVRGLFTILDENVYHEDKPTSALVCLGVGVPLCILIVIVHPFVYRFVNKFQGVKKEALIDVFTVVKFVGCVFSWRGLWYTFEYIILKDAKKTYLDEVLSIGIGIPIMLLLGCSCSINSLGIGISALKEWPISCVSHQKLRFQDLKKCQFLNRHKTIADCAVYPEKRESAAKIAPSQVSTVVTEDDMRATNDAPPSNTQL